MLAASIPAIEFLAADYLGASKLLLGSYKKVQLVLIGCGGTGSWLAPAVCRIGRLAIERDHKPTEIIFVDPDRVEKKNVYRQNFCEAETGQNKAEALAWRYGLAWGLEIRAIGEKFDRSKFGWAGGETLMLLIGCVDNPEGRREIEKAARTNDYLGAWWLDCGNSRSSGQALLGSGAAKPEDPFRLPGFCAWLPLPSVQHPELLKRDPHPALPQKEEDELSCAEMALRDAQGLMVNQRMAAEAGDMLARMLLTRDLTRFATYFDLKSGSARSRYITRQEVLDGIQTS